MVVDQNLGRHVLFEQIRVLPELLLLVGELLEALVVHERVGLAGRIEELHLPLFEVGLVEPLPGAKGAVQHVAGPVVFQLRAHKGAALAWFHVLELHDVVGLAVQFQSGSVAKIRGGNHCLVLLLLRAVDRTVAGRPFLRWVSTPCRPNR